MRTQQQSQNTSMYMFVPKENKSTQDIYDMMSNGGWADWVNKLNNNNEADGNAPTTPQVSITMPSYKIDFKAKTTDALKSLGIVKAFTKGEADFSNMLDGDKNASLGNINCDESLVVNRYGLQADAYTTEEPGTVEPSQNVIDLRVDRPFVTAIVDNDTGAILFIGTVNDPTPLS